MSNCKKIIINESQFSVLLSEESGISEIVTNKKEEVFNLIVNALKKDDNINEKNEFYSYTKLHIDFYFFENKVSCDIDCYNYFSKEYYDFANIDNYGWSVFINKRLSLMGLIIPCISGTIVKKDAMDSIQHELEHLYQQIMMGKIFKDSYKYANIKTNRNSNDEIVRKTAELVYGCIKSEQDGFINGLYAYLMAMPKMVSWETLKETPAWKLYSNIVETYNLYKDHPLFITELKKYKVNQNNIFKAINNFIKKIGRTYNKVLNDKMEKQGWRTKNFN